MSSIFLEEFDLNQFDDLDDDLENLDDLAISCFGKEDICKYPLLDEEDLIYKELYINLGRVALAMYRMVSVHEQRNVGCLSTKQQVVCMKAMLECQTIVEVIHVLKQHFAQIVDVKLENKDIYMKFRNTGFMSHMSMFNDFVDQNDMTPLSYGEVHVMNKHHALCKPDTLSIVMSYVPINHFTTNSFIQIDEVFVYWYHGSKRRKKNMPSYKDIVDALKDITLHILHNDTFMKREVAQFAFQLVESFFNCEETTILHIAASKACDLVSVNQDNAVSLWNFVLEVFNFLFSDAPRLAKNLWSIFARGLSTKTLFSVSCKRIGPMFNEYCHQGVVLDSITHEVLNIRASMFLNHCIKKLATSDRTKAIKNHIMLRMFVPTLVARTVSDLNMDLSLQYVRKAIGLVDVNLHAPFTYLDSKHIDGFLEKKLQEKQQQQPTKTLIPLTKSKMIIKGSKIIYSE